jgi:cytoskeletal protein RodZ
MALLLLEALGAGLIFVAIIWWTMFSGRTRGELRRDAPDSETTESPEKSNKNHP